MEWLKNESFMTSKIVVGGQFFQFFTDYPNIFKSMNSTLERTQRLIVNKLEKVQQLSVAGIGNPSRTSPNYFINFPDEKFLSQK
jgi:hypothetical protein